MVGPGLKDERTYPRAAARLRPLLWRAAAFGPAVAVLLLCLAWVRADGGYFPRDWYPAAIAIVGLAVVVAAVGGRALPRPRAAKVAVLLLLAWVGWTFLSLVWSTSPGGGWESANKLALYALAVWVLAVLPWTGRSALVAMTAWALGVAGLLALELHDFATTLDPATFLANDRYTDSLGYTNATAAIAAMAMWPALLAAARRDVAPALQVLCLAAAAFLVQYALLPQSRATMAATLVVAPLFVALAPDRLRLLARVGVLAGVVALSVGPIFAVYVTAAQDLPLGGAVDGAATAIARGVLVAALAGLALALLEGAVRPGRRAMRAIRASVALGLALAALGGASLAVANGPRIAADLGDRWQTFKSSDPRPQEKGPRLGARYSDKRYDYWRVSLAMWREDRLRGAGAGAFEPRYAAEKRHGRHARFPHDLWLRSLAETGGVGLGLLAGFLLVAMGGVLHAYRRADSRARGATAAALAVTVYFLLHASLDFLEEFPALVAPALAVPIVALVAGAARAPVAAGPREPDEGEPFDPGPDRRRRRVRRVRALGWVGAAGLVAACLASLVFPYVSHRYVERAEATWRTDPAGAVRDLQRAARVNPWSVEPHVTLGTLAMALGAERAARRSFNRALEVERTWYPYLQLGLLDAQEGSFRRAERRLARAARLNREDELVQEARDAVADRERIDAMSFTQRMLQTSLDNAARVG